MRLGFLTSSCSGFRDPGTQDVHGVEMLELTRDGFVALASQCALPPSEVRRHLAARDGTDLQADRFNGLERHLFHTRGAIWPVRDLLRAAEKARRERGSDDAVVDWQGEVFAARGLLRPDGYVLYRQACKLYGAFILESSSPSSMSLSIWSRCQKCARFRWQSRRGTSPRGPACRASCGAAMAGSPTI
jgi:hypothetical protein